MASDSKRYALLSVSDKSHLLTLAEGLRHHHFHFIATGKTAALLREQGLPVNDASEITGFPEMMEGRVKTLHPHIHAGILARGEQDAATLQARGIAAIELVIVNLYPFAEVTRANCDFATAIENIDIGGPTLIRAAAKNHAHVGVCVDPADYESLLQELNQHGALSLSYRRQLATKAFEHIAHYDIAIASYLQSETLPEHYFLSLQREETLRYGENPQQHAALYRGNQHLNWQQLAGKPLSFNNLLDADTAITCAQNFAEPTCVIVKHATPCGVATDKSTLAAYQHAYATDPSAAFGGIIAFNRSIDADTLQTIIDQQFVEVICAPDINEHALLILQKKPAVRMIRYNATSQAKQHDIRCLQLGVLIQEKDSLESDESFQVVTTHTLSTEQWQDLRFAWSVVKHVKSNAIVLAAHSRTVGIGAGQCSRHVSTDLAIRMANAQGLSTTGTVLASDAFFPFADSIKAAADAGVTAIIQPGGSIRDAEVIAAANAAGIIMVFTGQRHFRH